MWSQLLPGELNQTALVGLLAKQTALSKQCCSTTPRLLLHGLRQKRHGEVHGKDYIFVSKEQFEGWVQGDQLLEHAVVYGDYKGIPKQQVTDALDHGTDVVMRIDVQGAATIRRLLPHSIFVFLVSAGLP